jgi:hypothetical protein
MRANHHGHQWIDVTSPEPVSYVVCMNGECDERFEMAFLRLSMSNLAQSPQWLSAALDGKHLHTPLSQTNIESDGDSRLSRRSKKRNMR